MEKSKCQLLYYNIVDSILYEFDSPRITNHDVSVFKISAISGHTR